MAGRPSERINWDGLGNEADEDASEMNYEYEWVVPDHDEEMEQSPRHRRGGRLGLAGRGRAVGVGRGRGSAGHTGHGGGSARRSQLAQRVRSAVNRAMTDGNGEGGGSEDDVHAHGRRRLGLAGSRRGPHPVTRWPVVRVNQDANKNGGVGDFVEHVEEPHADNNVQGDGNGGASGSIDDIVIKVEQAFDEYPAERSNKIFLTLQSCMVEVLKQLRGNRYKVPHMRKAVKKRLGNLPITLQCTASIVKDAIESLPDV
ncbi:hypothetical protein ZWY2020_057334 [Hordeum vulgare]|nr:hypothetical protein ZWY2020_057334 [Hordeum vulgare]